MKNLRATAAAFPRFISSRLPLAAAIAGLALAGQASAQTRVACIGDSITYGATLANRTTECYPAVLQNLLGTSYTVRNYGVSGSTLLKKGDKPYWNQTAFTDSTAWNPNIVIIMLGTNDAKTNNWVFKADFAADYDALIAHYAALAAKPTIYVCTPSRMYSVSKFNISSNALQTEVVPLVRAAGSKNFRPVIDVNAGMSGHPEWFSDTVHPNATGASQLANVIGNVVGRAAMKQSIPAGSVTDSGHTGTFVPANTVDGSLTTRWAAAGDGQWLRYDLGASKVIRYVKLAFYAGTTRHYNFDVQIASSSGGPWTTIVANRTSSSSTALQTIDFPDRAARYVRILGHMGDFDNYNNITETEVWGF